MDIQNKKIVITGGMGFLGRYLQAELLKKGVSYEQIIVPDHKEYDLTIEKEVERMYLKVRPDVIIHLAAEVGGIGANKENPGRYFFANMAMGLHLIEYARRLGIQKFVQIGTICSYPKFTTIPFREGDLWNGYPEETNAPYGIAKKALLVMLQAYRQQYGLNGIYLMPVNLYGPGDNFNLRTSHVIPAMIRKFLEAKERASSQVKLWGTGLVSREFLYVEDCARAIMAATERYDGMEPVNIGADFEISIKDLSDEIKAIIGFEGKVVWDTSKQDGQPRRRLDVSRAMEFFGFRARVSLREGLRKTVNWYITTRGQSDIEVK